MGEAYLTFGNLAAAEEHLAALERVCLIPCDEYGDLQRAITKYRNTRPPPRSEPDRQSVVSRYFEFR